MANIPNLVNTGDRGVTRIMARKSGSMTVRERAECVAAAAYPLGATYVAVRLRRSWTIWRVSPFGGPVIQDLSEDAATMWLHHRGRTK